MEKKGHELIFISWIRRDGSGTVSCGTEWNENMDYPKVDDMSYLDDEVFTLKCLSLSKQTFIASGFNSFVVKIRHSENLDKLKSLFQKELLKYGVFPILIVMERMYILGEFEIYKIILQVIKNYFEKYNLDLPTKLDYTSINEIKTNLMINGFCLDNDTMYNISQEYANRIQESIKIELFYKNK